MERIVVYSLFAIFSTAFCHFQVVTAWFHQLDSGLLMEALTSIRKTGVPTTYLGPTYIDAAGTFTFYADALCHSDLIPSGRQLSVLISHSYFILYPLAMFTWLFPPPIVLAVANGLSFVSIPLILYWVIRKNGTPILGAILFCILAMVHPAWSHASLGNFYADRFFMPLGLMYVFLLYASLTRKIKMSWRDLFPILALGLLASSTTERGAIMIALFTMAALVLFAKKGANWGPRIVLILFSLLLLGLVYLYVKFLHVNFAGTGNLLSSLRNSLRFLNLLQSPPYAAQVKEFIVINILFFGIFALFNWKLALIAFAALLPNLLVTTGGAEKNGWATHYHSMYFPFLAFFAAVGYGKLWASLRATKYRLILIGFLLILMPAISNYSPGYRNTKGTLERLFGFYANGAKSYEIFLRNQLREISAAVPAGSTVTTTEGYVPTLYSGRTIYYYPIGIDIAQYAVLPRVSNPDGSFYYSGAVNYVGDSEKVNFCLNERLKKAGYDLEHPRRVIADTAVLKRRGK